MLSPEQAYAAYLQLEGPRTLEKLRQKLSEDGVEVPTLRWCQKWCARDKWRDRAKEHDRQVELRTSEKIVEAKAERRLELHEEYENAGVATVRKIGAVIDQIEIEDIGQLERLASIAVSLGAVAVDMRRGHPAPTIPGFAGPFTAAQITNGLGTDTVLEVIDQMFEEIEALPPPEGA